MAAISNAGFCRGVHGLVGRRAEGHPGSGLLGELAGPSRGFLAASDPVVPPNLTAVPSPSSSRLAIAEEQDTAFDTYLRALPSKPVVQMIPLPWPNDVIAGLPAGDSVALLIAPPLQKQELLRVPARVVSPDQPNPADRVLLVVGAPITAASYDIIEQCIRTRTSVNGNGLATALGGVPTKFLPKAHRLDLRSCRASLSSRQPGFQPSDCSIMPLATLVTERHNPRLNDTQSAILLVTKCLQAKPGYTLRTTVPTPHALETFRADSLDTKRWCSAPHLQLPTAGFAYSGGSTRCGLPLDV